MRLRKRGDVWHVRYYIDGPDGRERIERTTNCTDRKAAEAIGRQWERDAADPAHAARASATLTEAVNLMVTSYRELVARGEKRQDTLEFYERKAGQLLRCFGVGFRLASMSPNAVDEYTAKRTGEGASAQTLKKELGTLWLALRYAKRAQLWRGDIEELEPLGLTMTYVPRERWLPRPEVWQLLGRMRMQDRGAQIAFMVGVGAEWSAVGRAEREDVRTINGVDHVLVRGTKRKSRRRVVPLVFPWQKALVDHALANGEGADGFLFRPWDKVCRDIAEAADDAKLRRCSPNDLRRTFGTWLRAEGIIPAEIGAMMGHRDSTMAERVYAKLDPSTLATLVLGQSRSATPVPHGEVQTMEAAQTSEPRIAETPGDLCRREELNFGPWDYDSVGWPDSSMQDRKRIAKSRGAAAPPVPPLRVVRGSR
jgi:integrase